jgi:hypothetical protein
MRDEHNLERERKAERMWWWKEMLLNESWYGEHVASR